MSDHSIYIQVDPLGTQSLVITDEKEQTVSGTIANPGVVVPDNGKGCRKRARHGHTIQWCVPPMCAATIAFGNSTPLSGNVAQIQIDAAPTAPWHCQGPYRIDPNANADRYKYTVTFTPAAGPQLSEDPQVIIDDNSGLDQNQILVRPDEVGKTAQDILTKVVDQLKDHVAAETDGSTRMFFPGGIGLISVDVKVEGIVEVNVQVSGPKAEKT